MTPGKIILTLPFLFIWMTAEEAPLPSSLPDKQNVSFFIQKASFLIAYQIIGSYEGGYANVVNDLGEETYRGISRKFCKDWRGWSHIDAYKLKCGPPEQNYYFNDLTDWYVTDFYLDIWIREGFSDLENQAIANYLFDFRVHSPIGVKMMQKVLNDCGNQFSLDNQMNPEMVAALNKIDATDFLMSIKKERIDFYNHVVDHNPSQQKFLCHWLKRANVEG
jgi:lysozyme family protein